jgi:hypothetical protein
MSGYETYKSTNLTMTSKDGKSTWPVELIQKGRPATDKHFTVIQVRDDALGANMHMPRWGPGNGPSWFEFIEDDGRLPSQQSMGMRQERATGTPYLDAYDTFVKEYVGTGKPYETQGYIFTQDANGGRRKHKTRRHRRHLGRSKRRV